MLLNSMMRESLFATTGQTARAGSGIRSLRSLCVNYLMREAVLPVARHFLTRVRKQSNESHSVDVPRIRSDCDYIGAGIEDYPALTDHNVGNHNRRPASYIYPTVR